MGRLAREEDEKAEGKTKAAYRPVANYAPGKRKV
jgi:hypothetical protein